LDRRPAALGEFPAKNVTLDRAPVQLHRAGNLLDVPALGVQLKDGAEALFPVGERWLGRSRGAGDDRQYCLDRRHRWGRVQDVSVSLGRRAQRRRMALQHPLERFTGVFDQVESIGHLRRLRRARGRRLGVGGGPIAANDGDLGLLA